MIKDVLLEVFVLCITFMCYDPFDLVFMYGAKYGSNFDILYMDILLFQYCYNRQVARYEQRNAGRGQVAGNHASCKQRGSMGRQRKAGTSRLTGDHTFSVISVLEAHKERWIKVECLASECNLLLIMLSLQENYPCRKEVPVVHLRHDSSDLS